MPIDRYDRRSFMRKLSLAAIAGGGVYCFANSAAKASAVDGTAAEPAKKRVFFAQFMHETNTFHPLPTNSFHYSQLKLGQSAGLKVWEGAELTIVPGLAASPAGGGTVQEQPCREAIARIVKSLQENMPIDGVFLRLHGAMFAEGVGPAETVLVEEIRRVVGPGVPVACTFDLHGNIPARLGTAGDVLVGLKTAPHTDQQETAEHAGRLLLETLRGKIKPVSYVLPIPIIVQGEKAMTTAEPFHSLVEEAKRLEREGLPGHKAKILAATLFVGCAWTDSPDTGMAAMVTADGSRETARATAIHLARLVWNARDQFRYGCEIADLEEGVQRALKAPQTTVFLTDSGDNVTASAPGDLPIVLRCLVECQAPDAVVADLFDATAVRHCFEAGVGKRVQLSIGAKIEKRHGPPLEVEAEVVRLIDANPKMVVVRVGGVQAILADAVVAFKSPDQFRACGIDPLAHKIVVVKQGYLYPKLTQIAPRHIMLLTPGAADMRIEKLNYVRRRKPMYPIEQDTVFEPEKAPS
jgi:microcystin degradation protein MlrC